MLKAGNSLIENKFHAFMILSVVGSFSSSNYMLRSMIYVSSCWSSRFGPIELFDKLQIVFSF
jgi:hypothetical protein